jgi:ferredoxin
MLMSATRALSQEGLARLLSALQDAGFVIFGPRVKDGAITFDELAGIDDLPRGLTEVQSGGRYRLEETERPNLFGFASTAQSFKRVFHPAREPLFGLRRGANGPELVPAESGARPVALIGARGCDVAALGTLDGVLMNSTHPDAGYRARRGDVFILAVHCTKPGGTCFCTSMGTGPRATAPFDLALTEIPKGDTTEFVVDVGSTRGEALLAGIDCEQASQPQIDEAKDAVAAAATQITKKVDTQGLQQLLQDNPEHPRWDDVAARCLACGNCTMVCPTCFCTTTEEADGFHLTEDTSSLGGRARSWDSCFTGDFSTLHGGSIRVSTRSRYRQWLTHKFSTWFDQFGQSGCVGCGRCITWCPPAIDITVELAALRAPNAADPAAEELP